MGLDIEISIKRTPYTNSIKAMKPFVQKWDKEQKYDFEVCYWRKCWNVYHDLENSVFRKMIDNDSYTPMGIDDLKRTISLLKSYNSVTWGDDTIWTWAEHRRTNSRHIKNLKHLIKLMRKDPEIQPYLYISY